MACAFGVCPLTFFGPPIFVSRMVIDHARHTRSPPTKNRWLSGNLLMMVMMKKGRCGWWRVTSMSWGFFGAIVETIFLSDKSISMYEIQVYNIPAIVLKSRTYGRPKITWCIIFRCISQQRWGCTHKHAHLSVGIGGPSRVQPVRLNEEEQEDLGVFFATLSPPARQGSTKMRRACGLGREKWLAGNIQESSPAVHSSSITPSTKTPQGHRWKIRRLLSG